MALIPGATFVLGNKDSFMGDTHPPVTVTLDSFWLDKTEVTNTQFEQFVKATGYTTVAERAPKAEDFPGAPPENLVAGSVCFTPPDKPVPLNNQFAWWSYVKGANWRHPKGPESDISRRANHPVVHMAWADANAYCRWAEKRLPTEAEWDWASRGGRPKTKFPWGNDLTVKGQWAANIWQGSFPNKNTGDDGFMETAPAGSFPPNGYGLYDIGGNVWEWCSDWYRPDTYALIADSSLSSKNPSGPTTSFDSAEPGVSKRVMRGGSYLSNMQFGAGFLEDARGKGEPDTGTSDVGFRCARSAP